jgi:ankyrin repeat protein
MEMQSVLDNPRRAAPTQWLASFVSFPLAKTIRVAALAGLGIVALPHTVSAQDVSPNARLLVAARAGDQPGAARALVDGASPNARNRVGETALVIAIRNEHPALAMDMVVAGTDVNLGAVNGVTPLMAAAHAGQSDIARALLAKGADITAFDRLQKTAMIYAAGQGHTDVVVMLLRAGIDPNAVYVHELTALMWAAGYGKTDTVLALLDAGAKAGLKDDRGKSALDIAREEHFPDTAKALEAVLRR